MCVLTVQKNWKKNGINGISLVTRTPEPANNEEIPSQIRIKLKAHNIDFVYYIHVDCPIGLKFCTEHGSDTAVLCGNVQNDWATEK